MDPDIASHDSDPAALAHVIRVLHRELHAMTQVAANVDVLDQLLSRLESLDPRQARIVEMRYFGGLTTEQIARALGISDNTVKREWDHARAWLRMELSHAGS